MIALLKGKVIAFENDSVLLDVNGVGYHLQLTGAALAQINEIGMEATFYTHMQVRDDSIGLYGFSSLEEQKIFREIITVSGAGPRTALNILSTLSPGEFVKAIQEANRAVLTKVNGVGKKTAERLILELKDKFELLVEDEEWDDFDQEMPLPSGGITEDALSALLVLGYSNAEAEEMVRQASALLGDQSYDLQAFLKVALSSSRRRGNN